MGIRSSPEQAEYSYCYIVIPVPTYLERAYQQSISTPLGRLGAGLNLLDLRSRHISLGFLTELNCNDLFRLSDSLRRIEERFIGQEILLNGLGQFDNANGLVGGTYLPVWDAKTVEEMQDQVQHVFKKQLEPFPFSERTGPHCTTAKLPTTPFHQNVYWEKQADVESIHQDASFTFSVDHLEIRGRNRFASGKAKHPVRIDYPFEQSREPMRYLRMSA
jgi:2'-5' RNA ligase